MPFYLLNEDGTKLALEDLSGFLLLEGDDGGTPVVPTIVYGGGGGARRNRRKELYDAIDRTIRELLVGSPADVVLPVSRLESGPTLVYDATSGAQEAIDALTRLAEQDGELLGRLADVRTAVEAYDAQRQADEDEDDALMLLF